MGLQQTLKALGDPIRRNILDMLKKGRLSAGEISSCFEVTDASISRHLSVLKDADLVRTAEAVAKSALADPTAPYSAQTIEFLKTVANAT